MNKKIYIIWIGWIWISAIARYYLERWYQVFWSDKTNSELIEKLKNEWINIIIWEDNKRLDNSFELVVYTEAIPKEQSELVKARELWIKLLTYPKALAEIANKDKLITVAWTHWKSTTTSFISLILKNSDKNFTSVVWTLLKEFGNKNFYHRNNNNPSQPSLNSNGRSKKDNYFVIEACEYKRSFLAYKPSIWIITNIEIDHLDYYKDLKDYVSAYEEYLNNIIPWGYAIVNWQDRNCLELIWKRHDINYIKIFDKYFLYNWQERHFPKIDIKIPGEHILFDAKIAYTVWYIIWIKDKDILETLSVYNWVWRRMETIWKTVNNNKVISDYWHHPTEISLTLESLQRNNLDKKILTIFQPHQYNRTLELLDSFIDSFKNTDILIIPNIYESRDSEEDKKKINSEKLIKLINHSNKYDWKWFENTLKLIEKFDKEYKNNLIIILLWAWDIDDLRFKIKMI